MENDNLKMTINQHVTNPNLENKSAFTYRKEILGIDAGIFIIAAFISLFGTLTVITYFGLMIGIFTGLVLTAISILPLYIVHKEDPIAWRSYVSGFFAPQYWDPCLITKQRKVLLLRWGNNGPEVQSLFNKGNFK